jgi:hypothetical protein
MLAESIRVGVFDRLRIPRSGGWIPKATLSQFRVLLDPNRINYVSIKQKSLVFKMVRDTHGHDALHLVGAARVADNTGFKLFTIAVRWQPIHNRIQ